MKLQVLVVAVAVSLGVDAVVHVPPYRHYIEAVAEAAKILQKNVLSMEGNIPLLDDYRRDYAEIMHVINYHGIEDSGCSRVPYYARYQEFLNTSAPVALIYPEVVVTEIRAVIDNVHNKISGIKDLIDACVQQWYMCDELVHDTVNENKVQYGGQADILIAAGRVADQLNANNEKFEKVSKDLKAHQYVCTSLVDLETIVKRVADLQQLLFPIYC